MMMTYTYARARESSSPPFSFVYARVTLVPASVISNLTSAVLGGRGASLPPHGGIHLPVLCVTAARPWTSGAAPESRRRTRTRASARASAAASHPPGRAAAAPAASAWARATTATSSPRARHDVRSARTAAASLAPLAAAGEEEAEEGSDAPRSSKTTTRRAGVPSGGAAAAAAAAARGGGLRAPERGLDGGEEGSAGDRVVGRGGPRADARRGGGRRGGGDGRVARGVATPIVRERERVHDDEPPRRELGVDVAPELTEGLGVVREVLVRRHQAHRAPRRRLRGTRGGPRAPSVRLRPRRRIRERAAEEVRDEPSPGGGHLVRHEKRAAARQTVRAQPQRLVHPARRERERAASTRVTRSRSPKAFPGE